MVRDRAHKFTARDEMSRVARCDFRARLSVCSCTEDKFLELDIMQNARSNTEVKTLKFSPVEKIDVELSFMIINCLNVSLTSLFQTGSIAVYFENTRETITSSKNQVSDDFSSGNAFGE